MKEVAGHADGGPGAPFGEFCFGDDYTSRRGKVNQRDAGNWGFVALAAGFAIRSLLFFGFILLVKLFAKLASPIAAHPGPVFVDTVRSVACGIYKIIGDKEAPAECLGKKDKQ